MFLENCNQILRKIKPIEDEGGIGGGRDVVRKIQNSQRFIRMFGDNYRVAKKDINSIFETEEFANQNPYHYLGQLEKYGVDKVNSTAQKLLREFLENTDHDFSAILEDGKSASSQELRLIENSRIANMIDRQSRRYKSSNNLPKENLAEHF